jgi:hypothetical protein
MKGCLLACYRILPPFWEAVSPSQHFPTLPKLLPNHFRGRTGIHTSSASRPICFVTSRVRQSGGGIVPTPRFGRGSDLEVILEVL